MKDMDDFRSSALILDSWVIVDLAKRVRALLEGMPGLKQTPDVRAFLIRTSDVPNFRHYIQHLESETTNIAESGRPIWGSISWVQLLPDERFIVRIYVPGRIAKYSVP